LKENEIEKKIQFYILFQIKQILTKSKEKINRRLLSKIEGSGTEIEGEKEEGEKKIVGTKPKVRLLHEAPSDGGVIETIQILPHKPLFDL